MNKRKVGADKEMLAADFLEKQGMQIVARNFRSARGEIDIIGYHRGYLVFVEVKYRKNKALGSAREAVGFQKQRQICKVADYYRLCHGLGMQTMIRYDVVAIQGDEVEWIPNAFPHIYVRG